MPHHPRQRDPNVAIDKLRTGRPRGRVVMHTGPFDLRSITLAGRVVHGQQNATVGGDDLHSAAQHDRGQRLDLASHSKDEVIIVLIVLAKFAGPQPTRHGAASRGEQQAAQQRHQPPGRARIQNVGHPFDPGTHAGGQTWRCHPWLSRPMQEVVNPLSCLESLSFAKPSLPRAHGKPTDSCAKN